MDMILVSSRMLTLLDMTKESMLFLDELLNPKSDANLQRTRGSQLHCCISA